MSTPCKLGRTRPVVAGRQAAVASAHPLATLAGYRILEQGGNAVDAVVAMAASLGVVEPYMSGPGGVGFMLLHRNGGEPVVLNFSGCAPLAATPDQFTPESQDLGCRACLVPGNVAGWFEALSEFGSMPAEPVFAPAISLARDGFPLHPFNVRTIEMALPRLNQAGKDVYGNVPLQIGAILRQTDLAESLEQMAQEGAKAFYTGDVGKKIIGHLQENGGLLSAEDLASYQPDQETPIGIDYRGCQVRTCPPNNEGFQILQTLKLLEAYDLTSLGHNSAAYVHTLSEAIKLAVADRIQWAGDPKFAPVPLDRLLDDAYIRERRSGIDPQTASRSEGERWRGSRDENMIPPGNIDGLTTHLAAVDSEGNVASITQSLGNGFGSGVIVPGTGIALNNFVWWCEIDPTCPTPNLIAPGKRWASCMAPVHVLKDDRFWFSIATPGSYGILHTTLQMLLAIIEFGADPQAAIEAPRFRVWEETRMQIEDRFPANVLDELTQRGHTLESVGDYSVMVGGGQAVMIDPDSQARLAGADPRRDGYALAY